MFYDESEREVVFDFFAEDAVGTGKGGGALCKEFEVEIGSTDWSPLPVTLPSKKGLIVRT